MAQDLGVSITGDLKVALRFDEFPEQLRDDLAAPIKSMTARLAGRIRARIPRGEGSGPHLADQVIQQFFDDPDQVSGRVTVSSQHAKAGALEYGAPGSRNRNMVRAHRARLTHVFGSRLQRPLMVMVAAHRRSLNVAEHQFMRGALRDSSADITSELQKTVEAAIGKTE